MVHTAQTSMPVQYPRRGLRILVNAVSCEVEMTSAKRKNPQSSATPSDSRVAVSSRRFRIKAQTADTMPPSQLVNPLDAVKDGVGPAIDSGFVLADQTRHIRRGTERVDKRLTNNKIGGAGRGT